VAYGDVRARVLVGGFAALLGFAIAKVFGEPSTAVRVVLLLVGVVLVFDSGLRIKRSRRQ
jgi:uncharacterized membrane protein YuzA (DUF378 family)